MSAKTVAKNSAIRTKNFVKKHRVAIAVVLTSAVWFSLQVKSAEQFNEFLKEHALFDEYYAMDEDIEAIRS